MIIVQKEIQELELLQADIEEKLKKSEDDIRHGRVKKAEEVFKELRAKYGY